MKRVRDYLDTKEDDFVPTADKYEGGGKLAVLLSVDALNFHPSSRAFSLLIHAAKIASKGNFERARRCWERALSYVNVGDVLFVTSPGTLFSYDVTRTHLGLSIIYDGKVCIKFHRRPGGWKCVFGSNLLVSGAMEARLNEAATV